MSRHLNIVASVVLASLIAVSTVFTSAPARADAVPPAPSCPSGMTGVTSHRGPQCMENAPKNCPNGWSGVLGGKCVLRPCESDASCEQGSTCVEHSVCLEPQVDEFYEYNEEPQHLKDSSPPRPVPGSLLGSAGLFAGPMRPKVRRPKPITRYQAVNLCARDVACGLPSTCQPEKLCVPKGTRAVAYKGTNIQSSRVKRTSEVAIVASKSAPSESSAVAQDKPIEVSPVASGVASPSATSSATTPGVSTVPSNEKRGCAACASTTSCTSEPWVASAFGLAWLVARRRRRGHTKAA